MRTQLILTTAALGVASSLGAFGQVYSVNAVGYINITVPAKSYVLTANQLNVGGNTLKEVLASVPDGTVVFKYTQASGFAAIGFEFGEWGTPTATVKPGEGFFLQNNNPTAPLTVTLVGEVPQGTLSTALLKGLNLISSQVPQAGKLVTDLKFPATEGDVVYQWDTTTQKYKDPNGFEFGEWGKGEPNIAVGEGFFVNKAANASWDRTFSVN
jgi:hypothetical protein